MLDIQNLATARITRSRKFACNLVQHTDQRKRDAGNNRRVALDRQLQREHEREIRTALSSSSPTDIIENEGCMLCKRSLSNCACCKECGRFDCTCEDDSHNYENHHVILAPAFPQATRQPTAHKREALSLPLDAIECKDCKRYICRCETYNDSFDINHEKDNLMSNLFNNRFELGTTEFPKMRRNFVALTGGRVKKSKNRLGDCYYDSEYRRPVLRINGLNMPEVREYFDEIAANKQEEQKAAAEAMRLELKEKRKAAKAARKARRKQKEHERVLHCYQHPTRLVFVTRATGRKLPPGRVVKDASGKLVFQPYEEALAA
jgi:hypothetical protein